MKDYEKRIQERERVNNFMKWFFFPIIGLVLTYFLYEYILTTNRGNLGSSNALKYGMYGMVVITFLGMFFKTQYGIRLYGKVSILSAFFQNILLFIFAAGIANFIHYFIRYHTKWIHFEGYTLNGFIYSAIACVPFAFLIPVYLNYRKFMKDND